MQCYCSKKNKFVNPLPKKMAPMAPFKDLHLLPLKGLNKQKEKPVQACLQPKRKIIAYKSCPKAQKLARKAKCCKQRHTKSNPIVKLYCKHHRQFQMVMFVWKKVRMQNTPASLQKILIQMKEVRIQKFRLIQKYHRSL